MKAQQSESVLTGFFNPSSMWEEIQSIAATSAQQTLEFLEEIQDDATEGLLGDSWAEIVESCLEPCKLSRVAEDYFPDIDTPQFKARWGARAYRSFLVGLQEIGGGGGSILKS